MKAVFTLLCLILLTGTVSAGPLFTITPVTDPGSRGYEGAEGFETSMPPSGWTRQSDNMGATWGLWGLDPFEGSQCAIANMDIMGDPVDEWLGFFTSYTADQTLRFAMKGQTAVNATVRVWVGEDLVFDFGQDWSLPSDQWGLVEIDLSQTNYAGFPNVHFAWQSVGTFNPEVFLDAVSLETSPVAQETTDWGGMKALFR